MNTCFGVCVDLGCNNSTLILLLKVNTAAANHVRNWLASGKCCSKFMLGTRLSWNVLKMYIRIGIKSMSNFVGSALQEQGRQQALFPVANSMPRHTHQDHRGIAWEFAPCFEGQGFFEEPCAKTCI